MNEKEEPVDVTAVLLELFRGMDIAFEEKSGEPITPQTEQERYAAALAAIGRFLSKTEPTHADRLFVLSEALADLSIGARPLILRLQIPVHRGQSFRRIADSIPVIADSFS
jgi:hypothetical protein